jgi:small subunit ribosomal protein S17
VSAADMNGNDTNMTNQSEKKLRTVEGRVVSNKMDKTVTVLVERQVKHALYGKYIRRSTKLHAHDAENACNEGDQVRVAECAPMSKTKNWRVVEIVARAAE